MKATLFRLPARNLLVIEDDKGDLQLEYPATEVRAHQIAQDAGVPNLTFGLVSDLVTVGATTKPRKK